MSPAFGTMPSSGKIYIDSCTFIDLAKVRREIRLDTDRQKEIWYAEQILRATRAKEISAFTSTLTIAECLHIDQEYPPEVQRIFRILLSGANGVIPVSPDLFVVERARDLRWIQKIALKPMDSIHVASALEAGCTELITTDQKMLKRLRSGALNAAELGLRAILASETTLLPDEYRQGRLLGIAGQTEPGDENDIQVKYKKRKLNFED